MKRSLQKLMLIILLFISSFACYAQCEPKLITNNPEILFDGEVNKFLVNDHYLYAGGSFKTVGRNTGGFSEVSRANGKPMIFSKAAGRADGIPDGSGGMVVFGSFSKVDGSLRNNVAIVNASGQITAFNPDVNAAVNAAAVYNGVLYIGGYFTTVNGVPRNRLAAIDINTGNLLPWDPNITNSGPLPCRLECMMQYNGQIYIGGVFSHIGTTLRRNIAAIDAATGAVSGWAPQAFAAANPAFGSVLRMHKVNNLLFICGAFDYAGGKVHPDVAAIDLTTGISTNWRPDPNSVVFALASKGDTLYMGGAFYSTSGLPRQGFAAYSIASGSLLPIAINTGKILTEQVYSITTFGDTILIGGVYDTIGGQLRKNLAAFNRLTGAILPWKCHTNGTVRSINIYNNRLFLGGDFYSTGRKEHVNIAQLDLDADTITTWDPKVNGEVKSINIEGKQMYIGGYFTKVGDSARNYNAAMVTGTTKILKWDPDADSIIYSVRRNGADVYIGGVFSSIKGQQRNGLAKLDTAGNLLPWTAINGFGSHVYGLEILGNKLYVGGAFNDLGGRKKTNIGSIDLSTGLATAWKSATAGPVYFMQKEDYAIFYAGGNVSLNNIGGNLYMVFDEPIMDSLGNTTKSIGGVEGPLQLSNNVAIRDVVFSNGRLYVAGAFKKGAARGPLAQVRNLGEIDIRSAFSPFPSIDINFTPFDPDYEHQAVLNTVAAYGNKIYAGGSYFGRAAVGDQNASLYHVITAELETSAFTDSNNVCSGLPVTVRVKSTITYGVTYHWNVNGVNISNTLPYYTFLPKTGDSISCVVTSPSTQCIVAAEDTTNSIVFAVTQTVIPDISITSVIEEESGKQVTVKAIVKDAATGYSIEWFNKGISIGKTAVDTFNYTKGAGTDSIYAVITPRTDTCYVTDTSGLIVVNEKPVGIGNITGDARVMVYPNPFNTYVKVAGVERGDILILYDVTGREISTGSSNSKEDYLLETGKLNTGVYVLKVIDQNGMLRKSILIQKL